MFQMDKKKVVIIIENKVRMWFKPKKKRINIETIMILPLWLPVYKHFYSLFCVCFVHTQLRIFLFDDYNADSIESCRRCCCCCCYKSSNENRANRFTHTNTTRIVSRSVNRIDRMNVLYFFLGFCIVNFGVCVCVSSLSLPF